MQLIVQKLGGRIEAGGNGYGETTIQGSKLYASSPAGGLQTVWMSLGDDVKELPQGFKVVARSSQGSVAAIENQCRKLYGLQYHPEASCSKKGMETLRRFMFDICHIKPNWIMENVFMEAEKDIQKIVEPDEHVICPLSGEFDSIVVAALVYRTIGDRLHCIFIDNGLLGFEEKDLFYMGITKDLVHDRTHSTFEEDLHFPVTVKTEPDRFLSKLRGLANQDSKTEIIERETTYIF